jgi:hypothetical protein
LKVLCNHQCQLNTRALTHIHLADVCNDEHNARLPRNYLLMSLLFVARQAKSPSVNWKCLGSDDAAVKLKWKEESIECVVLDCTIKE